jgi:RNA polymerase sigma-70 factor, ECF subfamily
VFNQFILGANQGRNKSGESVMPIGHALVGIAAYHPRTNTAERSDAALIAAVAAGEATAMRVLFARHYVRVYRFALRLMGSSPTAEDIANEVFFDVWRRAAGFEARSQVSTWLLAMTRNKCISAIRRRAECQLNEEFASTLADAGDNPEDAADRVDRSAVLQRCLRQLPPAQREVIDLVYYHERSISEVSGIVNAPKKTVKTRMFYARKRLSGLLATKNIHTTCA